MPWGWQVYLRGIAPGCHKPSKFGSIWNDSTHMAKKLGILYAILCYLFMTTLPHYCIWYGTLQVPWCHGDDSIAVRTTDIHRPCREKRCAIGVRASFCWVWSNDAVLDPYSSRSVVQGENSSTGSTFYDMFYLNFDNFVSVSRPKSVDSIFVD